MPERLSPPRPSPSRSNVRSAQVVTLAEPGALSRENVLSIGVSVSHRADWDSRGSSGACSRRELSTLGANLPGGRSAAAFRCGSCAGRARAAPGADLVADDHPPGGAAAARRRSAGSPSAARRCWRCRRTCADGVECCCAAWDCVRLLVMGLHEKRRHHDHGTLGIRLACHLPTGRVSKGHGHYSRFNSMAVVGHGRVPAICQGQGTTMTGQRALRASQLGTEPIR